jgi:hypothetical protein
LTAFDIMRSKAKIVLLVSAMLVFVAGILCFRGVLSTPRDFSSPQAAIRLVDESGSPLSGIEVGRNWYDSDCNKEGSDKAVTDESGISAFPKVPASVGLFTGAWKKAYSRFGMCGSGNGTYTTIYVRYHGRCEVVPKGKPLHPVGQSAQDPDGVWFSTSVDSQSNTMATLTFPQKARDIEYVLSSRAHSQ